MINSPNPDNTSDINVVLAEYNALRDEIIKRLEFRFQILNLIVIVSGTFLTVGVQETVPAAVILIYPSLALFLVISWVHNSFVLKQIGKYIRDHIETRISGFSWETSGVIDYHFGFWNSISMTGMTLTTQLLAVIIASLKGNFGTIEVFLLVCSFISIGITLFLLVFRRGAIFRKAWPLIFRRGANSGRLK
jgi:hypothetical protein